MQCQGENPVALFKSIFIIISFINLCLFSQLLHRVLVAEVNALQGMAAIGQRPLLLEVSELFFLGGNVK